MPEADMSVKFSFSIYNAMILFLFGFFQNVRVFSGMYITWKNTLEGSSIVNSQREFMRIWKTPLRNTTNVSFSFNSRIQSLNVLQVVICPSSKYLLFEWPNLYKYFCFWFKLSYHTRGSSPLHRANTVFCVKVCTFFIIQLTDQNWWKFSHKTTVHFYIHPSILFSIVFIELVFSNCKRKKLILICLTLKC